MKKHRTKKRPVSLKKKSPTLLMLIGSAWLIFVAANWLYHHSFSQTAGRKVKIQLGLLLESGGIIYALIPLIATVMIFATVLLIKKRFSKENRASISVSMPTLILSLLMVVVLSWNLYSFVGYPLSPTGASMVSLRNVLPANWSLLRHLGMIVVWLFGFTVVAHAAGSVFLRPWAGRLKDDSARFFFQTALGLWVLSMAVFAACILKVYNHWVFVGFGVTILLLSRKETSRLLRNLFTRKWNLTTPIWSLQSLSVILLVAMIAMTLLSIVRPCPVGWDDLEKYMNRTRLVADRGTMVPGLFPFPVELLMSMGFRLLHSAEAAMAVSWLGGILSVCVIVALGKRFWNTEIGLIGAAVWYTMPLVGHLSTNDLKIDAMLFFMSVLAFWAVLEWARNPDSRRWLLLAYLLAGIALTMKVTAIFLVVGLSSIVLYVMIRMRREHWRSILTRGLLLAAPIVIPLIPWLLYNQSTRNWQPPTSMVDALTSQNPHQPIIRPEDCRKLGIPPLDTHSQSWQDTYQGYEGHAGGLMGILRLPWDLTMNPSLNSNHVIIGYAFLGLLPLLWLFRSGWTTDTRLALVFLPGYWLFWLVLGEGVPWYGLAGFLPLVLLVGLIVTRTESPGWFRFIIHSALIVSLLSNMAIIGSTCGHPAVLAYAGGEFDETRFMANMFPKYRQMVEVIDRHPPTAAYPNYVYRVGTMLPYFITNNDQRLFHDDLLAAFERIDDGRNDRRTLQRLHALGFRYFLLDLNVLSHNPDPAGEFHRRAVRFVSFARTNLKVLVHNQKFGHLLLTYNE